MFSKRKTKENPHDTQISISSERWQTYRSAVSITGSIAQSVIHKNSIELIVVDHRRVVTTGYRQLHLHLYLQEFSLRKSFLGAVLKSKYHGY